MKNKKFNILIILSVLTVVVSILTGNAATVYAEDTDTEVETGQAGEYSYTVIETYSEEWPDSIYFNIEYTKYLDYPAWPNYIVNLNGDRQRVYQAPSKDSHGIETLYYGERCKVLKMIQNEIGELWYMFVTKIDGEDFVAFIEIGRVAKREFQLEKMYEQVETLVDISSMGPVVYIENYKNVNGIPPELPSGEYYDPYGYRRGQSATGYYNKSLVGEFRYIPDGALVVVEEIVDLTDIEIENIMFNSYGEFVPSSDGAAGMNNHSAESIQRAVEAYNQSGGYFAAKVYVPSFGESLWIESAFINMEATMAGGFGQAIVVDRANQNVGIFEYDNGWQLISLSYVTTGKSSESAVPTPLGLFMAIEKKDFFEYEEEDGTDNEGFAPYAIRFSGGGYLHGIPMKYEFDSDGNRKPVYIYEEKILSIGTIPESHMCVRNYTSHALFMYEWIAIGSCSVIVFE